MDRLAVCEHANTPVGVTVENTLAFWLLYLRLGVFTVVRFQNVVL